MAISKRQHRVIAGALAFLALLIFCGTPFQQAATAVAIVDDAIIAIVIAALAAMGITFTMTGGYQTVREWVRDKITESGIDFSGVKYGASSVGSLLLNNVFVRRIAAFATYIKSELGLLDNATTTIFNSGISIADIVMYPGRSAEYPAKSGGDLSIGWEADSTVYAIYLQPRADRNRTQVVLWNTSRFMARDRSNDGTWSNWQYSNEYDQTSYYYQIHTIFNFDTYEIGGVELYNLQVSELLDLISGQSAVERESLSAVTGTIAIPDDTTIGTQGGVLSLPVPWGQSMGTTLTDIPGLVLSDELAGNTTLELEDASVVEDQVSDTATAEQPYVSSSASDYQSPGLSSVFPFCIPFDLYEFFECLAADPEAPQISWRFYVPGICDEQIEIDLSQFDTVAQIVRTMELLAFIVGLALVTREKFLRG